MKPSVVVVGSCMIDLVSYTDVLPKPGETIHGSSFKIGFGGKGANQCVAAARLGCDAALVACVGDDTFGENYIKNLEENGINKEFVTTIGEVSTGVATIVVDGKGENSIIIVGGANQHVTPRDVIEAEELIKDAAVVVCQGEIKEDSTKLALSLARKHKVLTLMNAAPADPKMNEEIYALSDIFCVNETEAQILTGIKVNSLHNAENACKVLKNKGCKEVILTMGSEGAVFFTDECFEHISAPPVANVVDTTGAGDSFVGAIAYFISSKPDLSRKEMIKRSCAIASKSIQCKGTQTSFPFKIDVMDILGE